MTAQPYTAEQVLASFNKGFKGARLKAMAQEIAGLANENLALKQQISSLSHQTDSNELKLASAEANRILDEARASAFAEANRAWLEGKAAWQEAHEKKRFIPSPVSTAALELVDVLSGIGAFEPGQRRLKLHPGGYGATLSVGKSLLKDSLAEVLGTTPDKGESVTEVVEVQLFAERNEESPSEYGGKFLFAYARGHLVGGISARTAAYVLPFFEAMQALGVSVFIDAELTVTASEARGALRGKSAVSLPDKFALRDLMPKIRRIAKVINSIYVRDTLTTPDEVEWFKQFGRLSEEMRLAMNSTRNYALEAAVMGLEG